MPAISLSGKMPDDFKPIPSVGAGVQELRVRNVAGAFRIIYIARFEEATYVLHASRKDPEDRADRHRAARQRYRRLLEDRK